MRHISLRLLFLCLLAPSLCYILTIHYAELYLNKSLSRTVPTILLPDTTAVEEGLESVGNAVRRNIDSYLANSWLPRLGLVPFILVSSQDGLILYPQSVDHNDLSSQEKRTELGSSNRALLRQGLKTEVEISIQNDSAFAALLLTAYVASAALFLGIRYRQSAQLARSEEFAAQHKVAALEQREHELSLQLANLRTEKDAFLHRLEQVRRDLATQKTQFSSTEEELLQEIIALEDKLHGFVRTQGEQEQKILELHAEIEQLRNRSDQSKRLKGSAFIKKRIQTLYRSVDFHDRAWEGFLNLEEDLQLKVEENLQILNANVEELTIKRKITGRRLSVPVFEITFGYRGRLYFTKKEARIEILAIGDKNSQSKDLDYLEKL